MPKDDQDDDQNDIQYMVHDVKQPLPAGHQGSLDLFNVCFLSPGVGPDVQGNIQNLVNSLAPGGWFQSLEMDFSAEIPEALSPSPSSSSPWMLIKQIGCPSQLAANLKDTFCSCWLVNVRCAA